MSDGDAGPRFSLRRWLSGALKILGGLLVLLTVLLVIASIFGVRVPIHRLSGFLSPIVEGLGATARYAPGSYLEMSLTPAISLEDLSIAGEHIALEVAHLSGAVELLPLFRQQLVIRDARLESGRLELSRQPGAGDRPGPETPAESGPFELSPWLRSLVVETARVSDVTARVRHEDSGAEWAFAVVDLRLAMPRPGDVTAAVGGSFQGLSFDLEARSRRRSADEWALEQLKLEGDGFGMLLSGQADPRSGSAAGLFRLGLEHSAAVQAFFGTSLVPFSPLAVSAQWDYAAGRGHLVFDEFTLGPSSFDGEIALDTNGPVPALQVDLATTVIDLGDWTERLADASDARSGAERPVTGKEPVEREQPPLAEMLNPWLEGALLKAEVQAGTVDGAPVPVTDLLLGVSIENETLTLPVAVTVGDVPFRGAIAVQTEGDLVRLSAPLIGPPSDAGELLRLLFAVDELDGSHAGLEVVASAQGRTPAELADSVRVTGTVEGARLSYGTRPVNFSLETMTLESSMQQPTVVTGAGDLLGQPFEITARSDSLAELADPEDMRFETEVMGPDTRLAVAAARTASELTMDVDFESSDTGVLRDWLALYPAGATQVALGVRLERAADSEGLRYVIDPLRVGDSGARMEGVLRRPDGQAALTARVRGDRVDVEEIMNLFAAEPATEKTSSGLPSAELSLDVPILPAEVSIVDADLDVLLGRLAYEPLQLTDFSVVGRTREGRVESAAVSAITGYGALNGSASADLTTDKPNLRASLELTPFRFGRLLEDLEFVESSELDFEQASVDLELAGATLDDLLRSADLDLRVTGGRIPLIPELGVEALIDAASLRNVPGEPIALTVAGTVRDEPLNASLQMVPLAELLDGRALAMTANGELGGLRVGAEFQSPLPVGSGSSSLRVEAGAAGLDAWNDLLDLNLPPWGPVTLAGKVRNLPSAYRLDDFRFTVGQSELHGRLDVDVAGKPRVDLRLEAPMIQLEDFKTGDWRATESADPDSDTPGSDSSVDDRDPPAAEQPEPALVSRGNFERLDASLVVDVAEVRSGPDRLGAGHLEASLLDGTFSVPELAIRTPAGDVTATGRLAWAGPELLDSSLTLRADRFDYGILARRIDPASTMKGSLTVNADLRGRHAPGRPLMSEANGVLQFGVWPEDFRAGVFDLWAIGLLNAVLPKFSDDAVSTMNCVIGKFRVTDGVLSEEAFLADSSKIQVTGTADADFRVREVDAYLSPEAKRAQIFSFGAPVEITGGFDDYDIGFRGGDLALAVLRFVTSPIVAPIRWLVEDPLPKDGEEACRSAWELTVPAGGGPAP